MALSMARPTKHPKTGTYRVRVAVPEPLRETTARLYGSRHELIASLGTKDVAEAKAKAPGALSTLLAKLDAARAAQRGDIADLTDRDVSALAGVWYQQETKRWGDNPGPALNWAFRQEELDAQFDREDGPAEDYDVLLSAEDRQDAVAQLVAFGYPADPVAVRRVALAIFHAKRALAAEMRGRAELDWSPDATLATFPAPPNGARSPAAGRCSFEGLVRAWGRDQGHRTEDPGITHAYYERLRTIRRLAAFLGHDDASTVTLRDAVRWKQARQDQGRKAATIRNDLSEMAAVWRFGLANGLLTGANPFQGILPPKERGAVREARSYTDEEARTLLLDAREREGWRRWLPWLLCFTGARLNELCQADKADVTQVQGVWAIRVHDEGDGRSLKNDDSRRTIPLHPILIDEGFLAYVEAMSASSPLFPDLAPGRQFGRRGTTASKTLGYWVRKRMKITDTHISPAHSWRHWFITACRQVTMPQEVRSAITGHSGKIDEGDGYGTRMGELIHVLAEHMPKVKPPPGIEAKGATRLSQ